MLSQLPVQHASTVAVAVGVAVCVGVAVGVAVGKPGTCGLQRLLLYLLLTAKLARR
jgi:ABC-type proline/glycine betaine transport system permease subunit